MKYYAWQDTGEVVPLGECANFDDASDKSDVLARAVHWIFGEEDLREFVANAQKVLPVEVPA